MSRKLKTTNIELNHTNGLLKITNTELNNNIEELKATNDDLKMTEMNLRTEVENVIRLKNDLQITLEGLKNGELYGNAWKQYTDLQQKVENNLTKLGELNGQVEGLRGAIGELTKLKSDLEQTNVRLREGVEEIKNAARDGIKEQNQNLERTTSNLLNHLNSSNVPNYLQAPISGHHEELLF